MKKYLFIFLGLFFIWATFVKADDGQEDKGSVSNPLETTDEGEQRQAAERYQETPDHEAPLGGYQQALGNPYTDISQGQPVVVSKSPPAENPTETSDQAQERQQYEQYQQREANGGSEPTGGYQQKLGD